MRNNENIEKLTKLFMATGQVHHQAFIKTDGIDPDWATWYGNYLAEPLSKLVEPNLSADEITEKLLSVDKEFNSAERSDHWTSYYAKRF